MKSRPLHPLLALLCNIALLYVLYLACRVVYILEFWDIFSTNWSQINPWQLLWVVFASTLPPSATPTSLIC